MADKITNSQEAELSLKLTQWTNGSNGRNLVLVIVGKSGVGKSALINNFLELEGGEECIVGDDATTVTKEIISKDKTKKDVPVRIFDTPGLGGITKMPKNVFKELSHKTDKKADVLLYCISVHPGSTIDSSDVKIIEKLTTAFSSDIWRHTILCLTFANCLQKPELSEEAYKGLINQYAQRFERALHEANVFDMPVQSVFSPNQCKGILAVPVGDAQESLPFSPNWSEQLFQEILKQSNPKSAPDILEYKGLLKPAAELGGSIAAGTAIGAAAGAAIGAIFLGFGAVIGVGVGAAVGGAVGAALPTFKNKAIIGYKSRKAKNMEQKRKNKA